LDSSLPGRLLAVPSELSLKPGSIADIAGRLTLWARRNPQGLVRVEYSSEFARQVTIHLRAIEIVVKTLPTDHPYIVRGHNNFAGMVRAAVAAGQVGQLSDHPTTQAMLQQLRNE
jgi:hypothetical protein